MNDKYIEIFKRNGLRFSRMLGSKSFYRETHPDHLVVFNTRIYLKSTYEKFKNTTIRDFFAGQVDEIWYGDIDFNLDIFKLYLIQKEIKEGIIVTSEIGNKIVEIGDDVDNIWIGTIAMGKETKGITLKDIEKE